MKKTLFLGLLLASIAMSGQTGLGILRPSLLELTETASAFDAKVKEAYKDYRFRIPSLTIASTQMR